MDLLTPVIRAALRANADAPDAEHRNPVPLVKFFNPLGGAVWLATELAADGDSLFGIADLGFGRPELGSFGLAELAAVRLPFGLRIERDLAFTTRDRLSVWAEVARVAGSIRSAETLLARMESSSAARPLPPPAEGGG